MATPAYKGATQQTSTQSTGLLGGLTGWLSVATPRYAEAPSATPSSTVPTEVTGACVDPDRITIVIPRELIESQS